MQYQFITSTFFTNLLSRLGVKPPFTEGFELVNTVQPVSLVDSDITLSTSQSTILLDTPFTTGVQVAPAATTVLADTAAQAAGSYNLFIQVGSDNGGSFGLPFIIARRNAANNADIWTMLFELGSGTFATVPFVFQARAVLQVNERFVVRVGAQAIGAGEGVQANIWLAT